MGVGRIHGEALGEGVARTHGHPGAVPVRDAGSAVLILHRALVVGEAGAQDELVRGLPLQAQGQEPGVLPVLLGDRVLQARVELHAEFLEGGPLGPLELAQDGQPVRGLHADPQGGGARQVQVGSRAAIHVVARLQSGDHRRRGQGVELEGGVAAQGHLHGGVVGEAEPHLAGGFESHAQPVAEAPLAALHRGEPVKGARRPDAGTEVSGIREGGIRLPGHEGHAHGPLRVDAVGEAGGVVHHLEIGLQGVVAADEAALMIRHQPEGGVHGEAQLQVRAQAPEGVQVGKHGALGGVSRAGGARDGAPRRPGRGGAGQLGRGHHFAEADHGLVARGQGHGRGVEEHAADVHAPGGHAREGGALGRRALLPQLEARGGGLGRQGGRSQPEGQGSEEGLAKNRRHGASWSRLRSLGLIMNDSGIGRMFQFSTKLPF